ncbi:MAG: hypothetical protein A2857_04990 [Candidatus Levybacteria bacterium RIFCSPHIGHO2_01_FULL_36_15]|nr:MAG: hypothetical protein A2857_04990 [Candidatus Levybacteria bacterium RIFCSPHIGHO2_01_FULL_36_15]
MKTDIKRHEDGTLSLKISVNWENVEKIRQETEEELIKNVAKPGFRKGNVPPKIAKESLDKEKVNEEMLKRLLPKYYLEALKQNGLNPIITPRVHVEAFDEGTDLIFTAETCEKPEIKLNNYKEEVKKHTAKSKIIVPGKEEQKPNLDEIIEIALKNTEIKIPAILIEQESTRLLSQLLDELKTLGLTLDQYLASKNKTGETLKQEYQQKAEKDLKLEFLLRRIADEEKITVEQTDIDQIIASVKDENQKKELLKNPYILASIIRQQKTLDFLAKI